MLWAKTSIKRKKKKRNKVIFSLFITIITLLIGIFYFFDISGDKYCKYMLWDGNNKEISIKTLKSNIDLIEDKINIHEPKYTWAEGLYESNKPKVLIYHHAAIKKASVEKIHQIHLDKDYGGIGYHFYITKDGKIYRGRPEKAVGAHTIGKNRESLGICLEGNYEEENMSDEQIESLKNLSTYLIIKYNLEGVYGHNDFYETACPGKNFQMKKVKEEITSNIIEINESNKK